MRVPTVVLSGKKAVIDVPALAGVEMFAVLFQ